MPSQNETTSELYEALLVCHSTAVLTLSVPNPELSESSKIKVKYGRKAYRNEALRKHTRDAESQVSAVHLFH